MSDPVSRPPFSSTCKGDPNCAGTPARSDDEFRAIFLHAPIPIVLLDETGEICTSNRPPTATDDAVRCPVGSALRCVNSLKLPESECTTCLGNRESCHRCGIRRLCLDTLETGQPHHREEAVVQAAGATGPEEIFNLVSCLPLWIGGHKRILIYLEDITELHRSRKQFRQLNEHLEEAVADQTAEIQTLLEQKETFIHQLGHDLRTPLTPMLALLPLLQQQIVSDKGRQTLDLIYDNARYMHDLVDKTLDLIRLDRSEKSEREVIALHAFVRDTTDHLRPQIESKKIRTDIDIDPMLFVEYDRLQLKELLFNLVGNAIKFMSEGGVLTIQADSDDEQVCLAIRDTGIGMLPSEVCKAFDEFYKADTSRHDRRSPGLGLSICRRIVERHGGTIRVESPGHGKGTTVSFTLPQPRKLPKKDRSKADIRTVTP